MTMKEVQAAIKEIDPNIFVNHKRINAVLSHFRKFGYQIHPGNWFDATTTNKIKWVLNWNNTVFDHISVVDDTLVIGKPDQLAPVGAKTADPGNTLPSGQVAPVEGLIEPVHHQTRIEFYGMGNKGTGQSTMRPAAVGTKNDTAVKATADVGDGSGIGTGAGQTAPGSAIAQVMGVVNGLIGALDTSFSQLTQTGLIRSEVSSDFALQAGIVNTGDGVTKDLEHYNTYDPSGQPVTGDSGQPISSGTGHVYGGGSSDDRGHGAGGCGGSITTFSGITSFGALGTGAVWKPVSEGNGNLVVLLPSKYAQTTVVVGGDTGSFSGFTNGNRGTYRFPKPGSGYEPAVSVTIGDTSFTVDNPATRRG